MGFTVTPRACDPLRYYVTGTTARKQDHRMSGLPRAVRHKGHVFFLCSYRRRRQERWIGALHSQGTKTVGMSEDGGSKHIGHGVSIPCRIMSVTLRVACNRVMDVGSLTMLSLWYTIASVGEQSTVPLFKIKRWMSEFSPLRACRMPKRGVLEFVRMAT